MWVKGALSLYKEWPLGEQAKPTVSSYFFPLPTFFVEWNKNEDKLLTKQSDLTSPFNQTDRDRHSMDGFQKCWTETGDLKGKMEGGFFFA